MSSVNEGFKYSDFFLNLRCFDGGLAQLARAFDWQSKGQGFDSPRLHQVIYHLLIKRFLSIDGFCFARKCCVYGAFGLFCFPL